jgi:hypothetical protein
MAARVSLWVNGSDAGPRGVAFIVVSFFRFFVKRGGAPGEFAVLGREDGMVNKLWITALMVVALALAPGSPASAKSAVEYGGLVSKDQGGSTLGKSVSHKIGSAKQKGSWRKQSKAKG